MDLFSTALGYVVKAFSENPETKKFKDDFFGGFVKWVRPLFLEDDETAKTVLDSEGNDALKKQIIDKKLQKLWEDPALRAQFEKWAADLGNIPHREKHIIKDSEIEADDVEIGDKSPDSGQYNRKGIVENSKIKAKKFRLGDG